MPLVEIFSSVQGEGKYVGCRQVFVRLAECNLRCAYCDTDFGRRTERRIEEVVGEIERLMSEAPVHSISLTGGEPLLHWEAIRAIAERLVGAKIFLETNGTMAAALERVIDVIDIVSMDIKLPHSIGRDLLREHRRFLEIARRKDVYVKLVADGEMSEEEFMAAVSMVAGVSREILLVLQPVTPMNGVRAISPSELLRYQSMALRELTDVRVIPQTHRLINVP